MGVQHGLGMFDLADQLAAWQRRGVAREDRVRLGEPIQFAEHLGLEPGVLGDRLDHHPRARHRVLQPAGNLHPPGALRAEPECLLCFTDVRLGVAAGCLALPGGYVKDAQITACSRRNGGDPAAERPAPSIPTGRDHIGRQAMGHGELPHVWMLLPRRLPDSPFTRFSGTAHGASPLALCGGQTHRAGPIARPGYFQRSAVSRPTAEVNVPCRTGGTPRESWRL